MMNNDLMFSQKTDVWATPEHVFDVLNEEFGFTLDPCTNGENAKCGKFYTESEDGLAQDWGGEVVFMNPPYSDCKGWMKKAMESARCGAIVVCLVPARTDTKWWHEYAMNGEIRLIKGRLKFGDGKGNAPFPSAVIVFRRGLEIIEKLSVQVFKND